MRTLFVIVLTVFLNACMTLPADRLAKIDQARDNAETARITSVAMGINGGSQEDIQSMNDNYDAATKYDDRARSLWATSHPVHFIVDLFSGILIDQALSDSN